MNDSYSAARVHVMRTKLLKPQQYEQLLKMSDKEIIAFLQSTEYRQDIDAIALKDLADLELIDRVIAHNTMRELKRLRSFSSPSYLKAIDIILNDNDRWNLKLIAEAIATNGDAKNSLSNYAKTGTFDPLVYTDVKTIAELAKKASNKVPSLRKHLSTLLEFKDALKQDVGRPHTSKLQRYQVDEQNLLRLLLLKRERLSGSQIISRFKRGGTIDRSILRDAANAATPEDALRLLRTTKYGKTISSAMEQLQTGSLLRFEEELHGEVLRRIIRESVSSPLHVQLLLRYLSEKEIEHQNIRLLVKGKRLDLEESFLREHLIMNA